MQRFRYFASRHAIKNYGIDNLYRDFSKLNHQYVKDKHMKQNVQATLRYGFRSNWGPEMFYHPNINYLIKKSKPNIELKKLYSKIF
jgi:hypothetical protein